MPRRGVRTPRGLTCHILWDTAWQGPPGHGRPRPRVQKQAAGWGSCWGRLSACSLGSRGSRLACRSCTGHAVPRERPLQVTPARPGWGPGCKTPHSCLHPLSTQPGPAVYRKRACGALQGTAGCSQLWASPAQGLSRGSGTTRLQPQPSGEEPAEDRWRSLAPCSTADVAAGSRGSWSGCGVQGPAPRMGWAGLGQGMGAATRHRVAQQPVCRPRSWFLQGWVGPWCPLHMPPRPT